MAKNFKKYRAMMAEHNARHIERRHERKRRGRRPKIRLLDGRPLRIEQGG